MSTTTSDEGYALATSDISSDIRAAQGRTARWATAVCVNADPGPPPEGAQWRRPTTHAAAAQPATVHAPSTMKETHPRRSPARW